jgi:hypothetical protein
LELGEPEGSASDGEDEAVSWWKSQAREMRMTLKARK